MQFFPKDERTYNDSLRRRGRRVAQRTGDPITVAEFDSILSPASAASAQSPSPASFEALAAAATDLINSNRPFPTAGDLTSDKVFGILTALSTYPVPFAGWLGSGPTEADRPEPSLRSTRRVIHHQRG